MSHSELRFDEIGYWSEVKLDIVKDYATAYSTILAAQQNPRLHHVYIDAFAGAGVHVSRTTGGFVAGSPLNALAVTPPFGEFYFIEIDHSKVEMLHELSRTRPEVHVYEGDCNKILLQTVFPRVRFEDYRRGLCILDPYGLHLDWEVPRAAGQMKSLDVFLNFPVMDMNRNVLWTNPSAVSASQRERMNRSWGDESWQKEIYDGSADLFGYETKGSNQDVADRYRERLLRVAGFDYVPSPIPMRNSKGAVIYYLFFASHKAVAADIVGHIFDKYRRRMPR